MGYVICVLLIWIVLWGSVVVQVAIDRVCSHGHFVQSLIAAVCIGTCPSRIYLIHACGLWARAALRHRLTLLSLRGLWGEYDVLLTDLHGFGGTVTWPISVCNATIAGARLRWLYNVAACTLNGLLIVPRWEGKSATWADSANTSCFIAKSRMAGWSLETFLVRQCFVLAWAHDMLWYIDKVSLSIFLHWGAQLLRSTTVRNLRFVRVSNLWPLLYISSFANVRWYDWTMMRLTVLIIHGAVLHCNEIRTLCLQWILFTRNVAMSNPLVYIL